jgi:predicted N-acyltransferase
MSVLIKKSFGEIPKENYQNLDSEIVSPFMQYDFLNALEKSKSVSIDNGWEPLHFVNEENGKLNGFMPLYKKYNSAGEFVFDHSWSHALEQAGRQYYPKLLSAIPFTPCASEKIIGKGIEIKDQIIKNIQDYMTQEAIESWHVLFPNEATSKILNNYNFIERFGCKFIWKNRNFKNFDDFLEIFTARQRKTIKAERKKCSDAKVSFQIIENENISSADWDIFYTLYCQTYLERWQKPYLERSFFDLLSLGPESSQPILFFAIQNNEVIGGSLCFKNENTLFGRHWGSIKRIDSLHFETCYYQGIEYCIKNNLNFFDPGVQGEHKIRRGFEPELTSSLHYFLRKDLEDAVRSFCDKEKTGILQYKKSCEEYTPIKKEYRIII